LPSRAALRVAAREANDFVRHSRSAVVLLSKEKRMEASRRAMLLGFSGFALGSLAGCQSPRRQVASARRLAYVPAVPGSLAPAQATDARAPFTAASDEPATCSLTERNIEGPYYRAGAPHRATLAGAYARGVPLALAGRVLSADCRSALVGAVVDIWQANADGHYDNDGSPGMDPRGFHFRGVVETDAKGCYAVNTIVPGRYLNGPRYRPAHIHVKLSARGHVPLTTQLYFPDDPFNDGDPFIKKSLVIDVEGTHEKRGSFDFVLAPSA
jgi:catechol 1,2-dioxygenase